MHDIFLTKNIRDILDSSGYSYKYYINNEEYERIINFYIERNLEIDKEFKEVIRVFGNRKIRYNNNSIPSRNKEYEISFDINDIWGKLKPKFYNMMTIEINHFENEYSFKNLTPLAVMPSGPMTFFVDSNNYIYGMIDELIVSYKGQSLWSSLEKLFKGEKSNI